MLTLASELHAQWSKGAGMALLLTSLLPSQASLRCTLSRFIAPHQKHLQSPFPEADINHDIYLPLVGRSSRSLLFLPLQRFCPFVISALARMTVYSSDAAALEAAGKKQVLKVRILNHL
jgi:hypothetical protein